MAQITASRSEQEHWTAAMQYNELGQEIERILPGDVISQWQYDVAGRPTQHRISGQNRHTRRRVYNWDVNHRLRSMVNELTGVKVTYGYDEFSNLVWSNQGGQFDFLHRSVDDVGNLYETKEKTDRVYGACSRLLETRDAKFSYDEEGNLVQKVEKNGDTWKYEYFGNGMMSKVIKPDNTEVTFKYDSLGRRIEKSSNEKIIQFVWDGNKILHEYFSQNDSVELENLVESQDESEISDNLVTWVFFNEGFVPSAKITSEGNYSIISDYLGTPVEAYDGEGKRVWSAELDVYGRVKEFTGEQDFIPFRYQGQYEDVEIGLYYNRFRYYSASEGLYTQQDPIGLEGNNPTLYGYVYNPNICIDIFGLSSLIRYKTHDSLTAKSGARQTTINRSWKFEKELIQLTNKGTRNWTQAEIELIKNTPNRKLASVMTEIGYTGHHINSVEGNGQLGHKWKGDPRNIVFLQNHNHPNGNEHVHSKQGHRGTTQNSTKGRLIDRQAMINKSIKCK
ncbi:RHS repeat domain-containing protein [Lysinibacillus sp. NPDC048646]|uniref:RHS repeat domain-containing protein n=1 Tax=Lysinibacillus sp. NPDC048646 TaxID=3390574 RepID=UPI003CFFA989